MLLLPHKSQLDNKTHTVLARWTKASNSLEEEASSHRVGPCSVFFLCLRGEAKGHDGRAVFMGLPK